MRAQRDSLYTALFLALALAVGGAGARFPLLEAALELAGLALLLYFFVSEGRPRLTGESRFARILLVLMLALPSLQLVPLPPAFWSVLPGREPVVAMSRLAGLDDVWRPISLDPEATRRALLGLLPPAAMFLATLYLPFAARLRLVWIAVGFALFGVVLGAMQVASGGGATPYPSAHSGNAIGLFVNRNHQAAFLNIAIVLAAAAGAVRARKSRAAGQTRILAGAVIGLLALGVVVTTSRMGTSLLPLAVALALMILLYDRLRWPVAVGAILFCAGVALLGATQSEVVGRTLGRFASVDQDTRFGFWTDTLWAIPHYLPVGSGIGSFVPVYGAAESLDNVQAAYANHAHNDFLQLLLEGGVAAVLLFLAFLLWLGGRVRRLMDSSLGRSERLVGFAGLGAILLVLLHSIVDYPLRMTALSTLFAMLAALLVPTFSDSSGRGGRGGRG